MPKDAELGRDLAQRVSSEFLGRIDEVNFTYDPYIELDELDLGKSYCVISPNFYEQVRETRAHWRERIQLVLTLVSVAGAIDTENWVDDWLDSWDTLIRLVREEPVLGKHKPLNLEMEERYNSEMFHNNRRLLTQAVISYGNVEVR